MARGSPVDPFLVSRSIAYLGTTISWMDWGSRHRSYMSCPVGVQSRINDQCPLYQKRSHLGVYQFPFFIIRAFKTRSTVYWYEQVCQPRSQDRTKGLVPKQHLVTHKLPGWHFRNDQLHSRGQTRIHGPDPSGRAGRGSMPKRQMKPPQTWDESGSSYTYRESGLLLCDSGTSLS